MSNTRDQEAEESTQRVRLESLPSAEKELSEKEAENVKGGGGLSGGVVLRKPTDGEIAQ